MIWVGIFDFREGTMFMFWIGFIKFLLYIKCSVSFCFIEFGNEFILRCFMKLGG